MLRQGAGQRRRKKRGRREGIGRRNIRVSVNKERKKKKVLRMRGFVMDRDSLLRRERSTSVTLPTRSGRLSNRLIVAKASRETAARIDCQSRCPTREGAERREGEVDSPTEASSGPGSLGSASDSREDLSRERARVSVLCCRCRDRSCESRCNVGCSRVCEKTVCCTLGI